MKQVSKAYLAANNYHIDHEVILDKPDAIQAIKESDINDDDHHNVETVFGSSNDTDDDDDEFDVEDMYVAPQM